MAITLGLQAVVELEVQDADTALAMASGDVPVLATPRLIALCEAATVEAIRPEMRPDVTSVGTRIVFEHLGASAIGRKVSVRAELVHVDGRSLEFGVVAHDTRGGLIGRGTITRTLVERERFLSRLTGDEEFPESVRDVLENAPSEPS